MVSTQAIATTWVVHPEGTGDAPTIQAAIDSASNGDSILVAPGNYYVNLQIVGLTDLVLVSEAGSLATILDGSGFPAEQVITIASSDDILIEGFTIQKGKPNVIGGSFGGGVLVNASRVRLERCRFYDNRNQRGGAISLFGDCAGTRIRKCTFEQNTTTYEGSALWSNSEGDLEMHECIFLGNSGPQVLHANTTEPFLVTDCTFVDNVEAWCFYGGDFHGYNCTAVRNRGFHAVGASAFWNCLVTHNEFGIATGCVLHCNNIWGNAVYDLHEGCSPPAGNGNFSADPLYCGFEQDDFTIAQESPCAPSNSNCGLVGAFDVGCTATSVPSGRFENTSWSGVKNLFR